VSTSWSLSHSVHRAGRQSRLPFSVAGGVTKMLRAERVLWLPPRQGRAPQRTGGEAVQPRHQQASAFCFASAGASRRYTASALSSWATVVCTAIHAASPFASPALGRRGDIPPARCPAGQLSSVRQFTPPLSKVDWC